MPVNRIKSLTADIHSVMLGVGGLLPNNAEDVNERSRLQQELAKVQEHKQQVIKVWDKKFFGRYSHLENPPELVDPKSKKKIDAIDFELNNFRFDVNDYPKPPTKVPDSQSTPPVADAKAQVSPDQATESNLPQNEPKEPPSGGPSTGSAGNSSSFMDDIIDAVAQISAGVFGSTPEVVLAGNATDTPIGLIGSAAVGAISGLGGNTLWDGNGDANNQTPPDFSSTLIYGASRSAGNESVVGSPLGTNSQTVKPPAVSGGGTDVSSGRSPVANVGGNISGGLPPGATGGGNNLSGVRPPVGNVSGGGVSGVRPPVGNVSGGGVSGGGNKGVTGSGVRPPGGGGGHKITLVPVPSGK